MHFLLIFFSNSLWAKQRLHTLGRCGSPAMCARPHKPRIHWCSHGAGGFLHFSSYTLLDFLIQTVMLACYWGQWVFLWACLGHICYQLGTAISMYHLLPGAWRRWRSMAEAFSSPSSCIEDRSGIFSSVFLSPPACPACVVPGCWARGGCTAVSQLCSGKAQGAAELSLPLHPPGLWHCLSFPTWNFIAQRVLSPQDSYRGCCFAHH